MFFFISVIYVTDYTRHHDWLVAVSMGKKPMLSEQKIKRTDISTKSCIKHYASPKMVADQIGRRRSIKNYLDKSAVEN